MIDENKLRRRERGFALVAALIVAILYIAFVELLLIDSARSLAEAQRFRSKVVAAALAENGAELAAVRMLEIYGRVAEGSDAQGSFRGRYSRSGSSFELSGEGTTAGVLPAQASVALRGHINGTRVVIDYAQHSQ